MKYIKNFENHQLNFINESKYTDDDIIKCIENKGYIYVSKLKNNPKHNPKTPVYPQNFQNNEVEVYVDGDIEYASMDDITEISYEPLNTDLDL